MPEVKPDGDIVINPRPPAFSPEIKLIGLKILGINMDISVKEKEYKVKIDSQVIVSKVGFSVLFQKKRQEIDQAIIADEGYYTRRLNK